MAPPVRSKANGNRTVGSVGRAVALIDALAASPTALGVNELARHIEVNPSSASRLLATLEQGGLVGRDANGRFQLGLRLLALADRVLLRLDVRDLARPYLHDLVERTGETATCSIPTAGEAVTVDFVPGKGSVVSMARVGRPNPLHATAIGKIMLAFGEGVELPDRARLTPFTEETITDPAELERVVERTREAGWADAVAERESELAALAVPITDAGGRLGAVIGLQGPLARMGEARRAELLPLLREAASGLSRELGAPR